MKWLYSTLESHVLRIQRVVKALTLQSSSSQPVRSVLLHEDWRARQTTCYQRNIIQSHFLSHGSLGSALTDVCITCCTFGVLTLLLRCLPLAVSASFTVTAFKEKHKRGASLRDPNRCIIYSAQNGTFLLNSQCIKYLS